MSYFEIKTIKGHDYLYLRQSIRIGNRVVHKHVAYLGRVDAGRITGSSGGSQTVTQAKREYQPKPVKEKLIKGEVIESSKIPIEVEGRTEYIRSTKREPLTAEQKKINKEIRKHRREEKAKKEGKEKNAKPEPEKKKTKLPTVKAGIGKGAAPGKSKIDRSDQEKLLRKKKKKLKKFLRKKIIKKSEKEPEKEFKFLPWD